MKFYLHLIDFFYRALSYNELSGAIPTQLGDLSQLIGL